MDYDWPNIIDHDTFVIHIELSGRNCVHILLIAFVVDLKRIIIGKVQYESNQVWHVIYRSDMIEDKTPFSDNQSYSHHFEQ